MNEEEFLKVCCIEPKKLQRYIQSGILNSQDINGNDICLITTLESLGCSIAMIKKYMDNYHDHNNETCLQILQQQRSTILNDIHSIQKNVDNIDNLIKQLREENSMREKAVELFNELHDETILDNDKDLRNIMIPYIYGDVYHHGSLDLKLRELILIVVNTTNHTLTALEEHIAAGLKAGLTMIEIKEAIYQCTPYIGLGKVQDALELINEEVPSQATVNEVTRFDKGLETQISIFGEGIKDNHKNAPKELKHIQNYLSAYCFGDFYTRDGLKLQTRELLTFVMLSTLGGCENQLRSHVAGNLTVGNTREVLIETITQCQPYIGFPRTLNAINIINEVAKED